MEATSESKWTTGIFVPFNWKRRESQMMFNLLDSHNTWLHSVKQVPILGIHPEVMHSKRDLAPVGKDQQLTISKTLTTLSGDDPDHPEIPVVWAIEEALDTETTGKWFFVYHQQFEARLFKIIDDSLTKLCQQVSVFQHKRIIKFPNPRRAVKSRYQAHAKNFLQIATSTKLLFSNNEQAPTRQLKAPPRTQRRGHTPQIFLNRKILDPQTAAKLPTPQPWRSTNKWSSAVQAPSVKIQPTREEQQQAEHKNKMAHTTEATSMEPTDHPTQGPTLPTVHMGSIDSIRTDLSEKMEKQLEEFQKTVLEGIQDQIQHQVQRSISEVTASASVDDSTLTNMSHILEEKFRREINSDKNFRDVAHNRMVDIEKTQKGIAEQNQKLQAAVKKQQEETNQQQEAMSDQIQLLHATIRGVQESNATAQAAAQASVVTLQEIVTTTNTNSQETQRSVAGLASSMAELTRWIQTQTPTTAAGTRSRFRLPPVSASPRRTTGQENDRPQGSPKPAQKKACQQTTPQRQTTPVSRTTTENPSPNRAHIATPPNTSRTSERNTGPTYLHNNPFGALAEEETDEDDILWTQLQESEATQEVRIQQDNTASATDVVIFDIPEEEEQKQPE